MTEDKLYKVQTGLLDEETDEQEEIVEKSTEESKAVYVQQGVNFHVRPKERSKEFVSDLKRLVYGSSLTVEQRIDAVNRFIEKHYGDDQQQMLYLSVQDPTLAIKPSGYEERLRPLTDILADYIAEPLEQEHRKEYGERTVQQSQSAINRQRFIDDNTVYLDTDADNGKDEDKYLMRNSREKDMYLTIEDVLIRQSEPTTASYAELYALIDYTKSNVDKEANRYVRDNPSGMSKNDIKRVINRLSLDRVRVCPTCRNAFYAVVNTSKFCSNDAQLKRRGLYTTGGEHKPEYARSCKSIYDGLSDEEKRERDADVLAEIERFKKELKEIA